MGATSNVFQDEKITGRLEWDQAFTIGTWELNVTGPSGNSVLRVNKSDQKFDFNFTSTEARQYRIRVSNNSDKLTRVKLVVKPAFFKLPY
jgi:hypothetical protein